MKKKKVLFGLVIGAVVLSITSLVIIRMHKEQTKEKIQIYN